MARAFVVCLYGGCRYYGAIWDRTIALFHPEDPRNELMGHQVKCRTCLRFTGVIVDVRADAEHMPMQDDTPEVEGGMPGPLPPPRQYASLVSGRVRAWLSTLLPPHHRSPFAAPFVSSPDREMPHAPSLRPPSASLGFPIPGTSLSRTGFFPTVTGSPIPPYARSPMTPLGGLPGRTPAMSSHHPLSSSPGGTVPSTVYLGPRIGSTPAAEE